MTAQILREIPVSRALAMVANREARNVITMSPGQWNAYLKAAYDAGWLLLELDRNECPRRAYKRPSNSSLSPSNREYL